LTLPHDVIEALSQVDTDVARAVVTLVEGRASAAARRPVDTLRIGRHHALIVIDPATMPTIPGCSFMRIDSDRAFIALEAGAGLAHVELMVSDRMEDPDVTKQGRAALRLLRTALKNWRRDRRISAHPRGIVLLEEHA
jgi:hypothetical protein